MPPNRKSAVWGWFTDLIALRGNADDALSTADDAFQKIAKQSRDPTIHHQVARGRTAAAEGRRELEKLRRGLIEVRDNTQRGDDR